MPKKAAKLSIPQTLLAWIRHKLGLIGSFLAGIPAWLKHRPEAVKQWRTNDRKKKKYRSFRLQKRLRPEPRYIPSSTQLLKLSFDFIWKHRRVFLSMLLIHGLIYFILIRTPVQSDSVGTIQASLRSALGEGADKSVSGTIATVGTVLGNAGSTSQNGTTVAIIILVVSLMYIWLIRQLHNKQAVRARDAIYQGPAAVISTLLVLLVLTIQLLPFALASIVYTTAKNGGLFVTGLEDLGFFICAAFIALLSFYWATSSIIGLYIVTLPGMYPMKALSSARKLVQFQRLLVFRRIVALPIMLIVIYILLLFLVIRLLPNQTYLYLDLFQLAVIPLIHVYLYKLYRSLI